MLAHAGRIPVPLGEVEYIGRDDVPPGDGKDLRGPDIRAAELDLRRGPGLVSADRFIAVQRFIKEGFQFLYGWHAPVVVIAQDYVLAIQFRVFPGDVAHAVRMGPHQACTCIGYRTVPIVDKPAFRPN